MIVQIYTMQTPVEALAAAAVGVDHLGLTPASDGLPGEITFQAAREIVSAVAGRARCIALTIDTDAHRIAAMVEAVRPDVLHLCPLAGALTPEAIAALRLRLPGQPIMQAISVAGPKAIAEAQAFAPVVDYLILDTQAPDIPGIGASGKIHDWSISRTIVQAVSVPVILAGGLSPENVAQAIQQVRPWGVDSLTHTNAPLPGGGFRKDIDRVRAFVQAARAVVLS